MHNRTKNLSDEQQSRFEAMVRLSDLLNLTMADDVIRTTGKYSEMLFTDFLEKLYDTIQNINDCKHQLYMDDFVRIARFSVPAIKHIVSNPSTHILKKSEIHNNALDGKKTRPVNPRKNCAAKQSAY